MSNSSEYMVWTSLCKTGNTDNT